MKKEDISVIIGVKNRYDPKIINALKSIRNQDYNQNLIKIILVDYDSKKNLIPKFRKLCKKYNADYIRVDNKPIWNRSHCLNIGIKRAKTKYTLTSDTDVMLEKNYIKEGIKELQKNKNQVILNNCLYSRDPSKYKKGIINKNFNFKKDYDKIKKYCNSINHIGLGINLTLTHFYHKIRGYDERYKVWGMEDADLIKRFKLLGLKEKIIKNTSYIHQWHPKFEGVLDKDYQKQYDENKKYFRSKNSIVRNKKGWARS